VTIGNTETSVYFTYFLFEPSLLLNTINWHKNILIYATRAKVLIPHLMLVILTLDYQPHGRTSLQAKHIYSPEVVAVVEAAASGVPEGP
jgi:hypothetical protein